MLSFPEWVPEIAAHTIRELLATDYFRDHDKHREAMLRLALDERMKSVWTEISRSQRSNYKATSSPFHHMKVYPDWEKILSAHRANPNEQAPRVLLVFLASLLQTNARVVTREALDAEVQKARNTSKQCLELAAAADTSQDWLAWAAHWENFANDRENQGQKVMLLKRQRLPPDTIGIIRGTLLTTRDLFGTPMYRTAATLTSVITGQIISPKTAEKYAKNLK